MLRSCPSDPALQPVTPISVAVLAFGWLVTQSITASLLTEPRWWISVPKYVVVLFPTCTSPVCFARYGEEERAGTTWRGVVNFKSKVDGTTLHTRTHRCNMV